MIRYYVLLYYSIPPDTSIPYHKNRGRYSFWLWYFKTTCTYQRKNLCIFKEDRQYADCGVDKSNSIGIFRSDNWWLFCELKKKKKMKITVTHLNLTWFFLLAQCILILCSWKICFRISLSLVFRFFQDEDEDYLKIFLVLWHFLFTKLETRSWLNVSQCVLQLHSFVHTCWHA